jgi:hypothetical protein
MIKYNLDLSLFFLIHFVTNAFGVLLLLFLLEFSLFPIEQFGGNALFYVFFFGSFGHGLQSSLITVTNVDNHLCYPKTSFTNKSLAPIASENPYCFL